MVDVDQVQHRYESGGNFIIMSYFTLEHECIIWNEGGAIHVLKDMHLMQ